ncbi:hypothetical protein COT72_01085 [archaeon CG10_big_fil_rev_8_21_14_0_10_43_11]|nr:MAG: hypothetical protein COT72_01085 [archaeon CG10_big_fil_rev_8_21_14_0_10_43_11]
MIRFWGVVLALIAFSVGWVMSKRLHVEVKEYETYLKYARLGILLVLVVLVVQQTLDRSALSLALSFFGGVGLGFILSNLRAKATQSLLNIYLLVMALWLMQFVNTTEYAALLFVGLAYLLLQGVLVREGALRYLIAIVAGGVIAAFAFVATKPTVYAAYVIITFCIGGVIGAELSLYDIRSTGKTREKRSARAKR